MEKYENAHRLCRFFKWLRVVKGLDVSPKEFLNELVLLRGSRDVEERQKYLRLVLEHTRARFPTSHGSALIAASL